MAGDKFPPDDARAVIRMWFNGELADRSPGDIRVKRYIARKLRSSRPLPTWLRFALGDLITPDGDGAEHVRLVVKRAKPGRRPRVNQCDIAVFVWRQTQAGMKWESAVQQAMKVFGCARSTVTDAWSGWRRFIERHPDLYEDLVLPA